MSSWKVFLGCKSPQCFEVAKLCYVVHAVQCVHLCMSKYSSNALLMQKCNATNLGKLVSQTLCCCCRHHVCVKHYSSTTSFPRIDVWVMRGFILFLFTCHCGLLCFGPAFDHSQVMLSLGGVFWSNWRLPFFFFFCLVGLAVACLEALHTLCKISYWRSMY